MEHQEVHPLLADAQPGRCYDSRSTIAIVESNCSGVTDSTLKTKSYRWRHTLHLMSIVTAISIIFLLARILYGVLVSMPDANKLQRGIFDAVEYRIQRYHLDGWTDGERLNNDKGRLLQVSLDVSIWFDYDKLVVDPELSDIDRKKIVYFTNEVLRSVCTTINDMATFDGVLHNEHDFLGSLYVKELVCIDLKNLTLNNLSVTVLVEPNMHNIIKLLKKLWNKDYKAINLVSEVDLTIFKQLWFFSNWHFKVIGLNEVVIPWNSMIDWDAQRRYISGLKHFVSSFSLKDWSYFSIPGGFRFLADTRSVNWHEYLTTPKSIDFPEWIKVPKIDWTLTVPDCHGNCNINLNTVNISTEIINPSEESFKLIVNGEIKGPLPDRLLYQICSHNSEWDYFETPITNIINTILSGNATVTFVLNGKVSAGYESDVVRYDVHSRLLTEILPITCNTNLTIDPSSVIEQAGIEGLRLSLDGNTDSVSIGDRLRVQGKTIAILKLPGYHGTHDTRYDMKDPMSIKLVKGTTELYHDNRHYLTVPIKDWVRARSELFASSSSGDSKMRVSFDVDQSDIIIINQNELSKVFNELLFKGSSKVHFESDIDFIMKSELGEFMITNLKTSGDSIII